MVARTPEELETLLEDAFVVRDSEALAQLFEDRAVLAAPIGEARGHEGIGRLAAAIWRLDFTYLAGSERVLQAGDTALVVSSRGINVAGRGSDGGWRYAISLLDAHTTEGGVP